jgi:hypothetical protein
MNPARLAPPLDPNLRLRTQRRADGLVAQYLHELKTDDASSRADRGSEIEAADSEEER